jgi:hypothetical protein
LFSVLIQSPVLLKMAVYLPYIASGHLRSGLQKKSVGIGAIMTVAFYDLHGTGKFDTVQVAAPVPLPFVPEWVR